MTIRNHASTGEAAHSWAMELREEIARRQPFVIVLPAGADEWSVRLLEALGCTVQLDREE